MTARSIGSATISFGLVSIPVKLFTTNESASDISFNLLHATDNAQLKQQYVCTACNEVVDREHTVKGYEHAKGQFVTFTADELAALDGQSTNTIMIERFVRPSEIDPIWYDSASYLSPDKGSERSFALLVQALTDTKRLAIGKHSTKGREYLVAIAVRDYRLDLYRLRFGHEVRSTDALPPYDPPNVKPAERELAQRMVLAMARDGVNISSYRDEVLARRTTLIEQKIATGELVAAPAAAPALVNPVDLIDALRGSLDLLVAPVPAERMQPPTTSTKRTRKAKPAGKPTKKASKTPTKGGRDMRASG